MDEMPSVTAETRKSIISDYEKHGLKWLQAEIQKKDPAFYNTGEIQNPQRLMRALEVVEATGQSILTFRKGKKQERDFNIVKIGLEISKEELHRNINVRVDGMMAAGLLEEVERLLPYKDLNALQTVGYAEMFDHLEGKISLQDAAELVRKNTRQYAKRQMTWFKKDKDIHWMDARKVDPSILSNLVGSTLA